MTNSKKQDEVKSGISPIAAAVTGAVIGAGIAVAGAVALKDEKNRDKVNEVLGNIKEQVHEKKIKVETAIDAAKESLSASQQNA